MPPRRPNRPDRPDQPDQPSGRQPNRPNDPEERRPDNWDADGLDQICWSCRSSIDHRNGLSLLSCDSTGSRQICETCWEQIPIADRIKLQWLVRSSGNEGAGLVDLIGSANAMFRAIASELERRAREGRDDLDDSGDDDDEF